MTKFEQEIFDRLGEVKASIARIETKLDADYRALHGNGSPGLVTRTGALEKAVATMSERMDAHERSGGRIVAFLGWLATAITAVYAAIFKQ